MFLVKSEIILIVKAKLCFIYIKKKKKKSYILILLDVSTNPIYVVTIGGTDPFIKIYQF